MTKNNKSARYRNIRYYLKTNFDNAELTIDPDNYNTKYHEIIITMNDKNVLQFTAIKSAEFSKEQQAKIIEYIKLELE